jgi:hypothetical protein
MGRPGAETRAGRGKWSPLGKNYSECPRVVNLQAEMLAHARSEGVFQSMPQPSRRNAAPQNKHRMRKTVIWLLAILVAAIAIRAALPSLIRHFANRKLDTIPEYRGRIGDVDLNLYRGAYRIQDIALEKLEGESRVPFFSAELVDFSVEWGALMRGSLVGEVELHSPRLNFVVAKTKKESQTGIDSSWADRSEELFPLDINRFSIRGGEIRFRDLTRTPKVDIRIDRIEALAQGLTTRADDGDGPLPATLHATGKAMGQAEVRLDLKLDPMAKEPTFDMDGELKNLELPVLNEFLKAYAGLDAEGGTFSLFTEIAASEGKFKGYVKPLAKDLKVFSPRDKDEGGLLQSAWEALVAGVAAVLENPEKERVATQIPLSGSLKNPEAGIWPTVGQLLRNAFISALQPSLTHAVGFEDVADEKDQK